MLTVPAAYFEASLHFQFQASAGVTVGWKGISPYFTLDRFSLEVYGKFEVNAEVTANAKGKIDYSNRKVVIPSRSLPDINFMISVIPVKISTTVGLDVLFTVKGEAEGTLKIGRGFTRDWRMGFQIINGAYSNIAPASTFAWKDPVTEFTYSGELTSTLTIIPWIKPSLYGIINPTIEVQAYVGGTIKIGSR